MLTSSSTPWYNRPARAREAQPRVREPGSRKRPPPQARPFPAQDWLRRRYGFLVPASAFARYQQPHGPQGRERDFPAKRWMDARRITNHRPEALSF
jgi:hypothetical protein